MAKKIKLGLVSRLIIADLSQGAGKLLGITGGIAYTSSLICGSTAFTVAINLFPNFMSAAREKMNALYEPIANFSAVINSVLKTAIIPLLPLYICGTFINMTVSGQTFTILNLLWKVFLTVIILHLSYLLVMFLAAGTISKKNPFILMKNQIPGYLSAIGTQSSAATIPVNLKCAEADGVSRGTTRFLW
ncbi:hypothetical protein AGMMS49942_08820 [Spirochaetia bacterium]|nr:hypothetical protein AGMMS49942_08820 [Spirochaetia bacterium]